MTFECIRAGGDLTDADLAAVEAFRAYLSEVPRGLVERDPATWDQAFPNRMAFEAFRQRWLPYLAGLAAGPTTREEYEAVRHKLRAMKAWRELDHHHSAYPLIEE